MLRRAAAGNQCPMTVYGLSGQLADKPIPRTRSISGYFSTKSGVITVQSTDRTAEGNGLSGEYSLIR